uniref:Uncharacterized protein n=1 Tax=Zonotrichia albicollis TaxID=44394 RepID=A0A8D2MMT4_ZONAL
MFRIIPPFQVGFLKILHKYEITFVLPPVPSLGKDICPLPVPNPNLRIVSVTSLPEGTTSPPHPQHPLIVPSIPSSSPTSPHCPQCPLLVPSVPSSSPTSPSLSPVSPPCPQRPLIVPSVPSLSPVSPSRTRPFPKGATPRNCPLSV